MTTKATHLVLRPPSKWAAINVREVWEFRDLLLRFTIRDLKLRYKQTALGVTWVVLQPLLGAGILSFVFGSVANLPSDGVPYFVFAYVGMVVWTLFSQVLTRSSNSLVANAGLVSKIFFPRVVLPLSTAGSAMVDFIVALALGVVVIALGGVTPGWAVLTLPLWVALALLLAVGLGLAAGALMVRFRDIAQILGVTTQLLLYATPVAYAISAVPESARRAVELNPLTAVVTGFRWAAVDTPPPSTASVVWAIVASLITFLAGGLIFASRERRFADVI